MGAGDGSPLGAGNGGKDGCAVGSCEGPGVGRGEGPGVGTGLGGVKEGASVGARVGGNTTAFWYVTDAVPLVRVSDDSEEVGVAQSVSCTVMHEILKKPYFRTN